MSALATISIIHFLRPVSRRHASLRCAAPRPAALLDAAQHHATPCHAPRRGASHRFATCRDASQHIVALRSFSLRLATIESKKGNQMPTIIKFRIEGIAPLSQSKPHLSELEPGESHDDWRKRTWREHLHADQHGEVFIPPGAIKNCVSEAALFMSILIPGKGKSTYTKHVEAGVACIRPVMLGINKSDVQSETLFLPADGKRGSGKRVWKTYPVLHQWSGDVELIILDETVLQTSHRSGNAILQDIVEGAGQFIGLHRFRPRKNGWYGRFVVTNFAVEALAMAA